MTWTATLLALALCQAPGTQAPAPGRDVVTLSDGAELTGVIRKLTPDYVELEIDSGTTVGFARKRVATIVRGAAAATAATGARVDDSVPEPGGLEPRDTWYALHNGAGTSVGRMHATVTVTDDGRHRVSEEWQFRQGRETVEVTVLEVLGADLMPQSCFYHERRRRHHDDRITAERLVSGTVERDTLIVELRGDAEPRRAAYGFTPGTTFPLALREAYRRKPGGVAAASRRVYDPRRDAFVEVGVSSDPGRRVVWRGEERRVREVVWRSGAALNTEWLDAASNTIRREINGVDLVAVPVTAALAERYASSRTELAAPALVTDRERRFGLWCPSPSWRVVDGESAGSVTIRSDLHSASATLMALDHLDAELLVESAADAVLRWLRLARRGFRLQSRDAIRFRDTDAVVLVGEYDGPRRASVRCRTLVFHTRAGHMALCLSAPAREFSMLERDLGRIAETVELHPESVREPGPPPLSGRRVAGRR